MDVTVHTGSTKAPSGMSLVSLSFTSREKERAFLLLAVRAGARDAKTLEEESVAIVQNALLSTEGEAWHRLDGTLKELNGLFKGMLVSQAVGEIHAVVALLDASGALHVSQAGRGEASLVRGGGLSQITEGNRGKPVAVFVHISSGALEPQDTILFATQRLLRTLTPSQLSQLVARGDQLLKEITLALDADRESAALAVLRAEGKRATDVPEEQLQEEERERVSRRMEDRLRRGNLLPGIRRHLRGDGKRMLSLAFLQPFFASLASSLSRLQQKERRALSERREKGVWQSLSHSLARGMEILRSTMILFLADLKHPQRKRRAHLLLLASALAAFLIVWMVVRLSITTQRSQSQASLGQLVEKINEELKTVDNLRLVGDNDRASALLQLAEQQAKQIINNDSGLYRSEGLTLRDRIIAKKEEIWNIVRISPRMLVNVASKNPNVSAQGLIGIADGEFLVYDRQSWYHILLNGLEEGKKLSEEELIIDGAAFPRYKSQVFLTTGNSIIELQSNQPVSMKTEDPSGWVTGKDIETYLRFLYVLSSDNKIYKYERLSNRYAVSVQYNVTGDLTGALDMTIDGSVYVLKENGIIMKLFRGEEQPFVIRHAPEGALKDASKVIKVPDRNFYFLDPVRNRVVITTDGGANAESAYLKQYAVEGEIGKLQDLYVDSEEAHLYVMDEKRVYVIDLGTK